MAGNHFATFTLVYFADCRCAFIALAAHFTVFVAVEATRSISTGESHSIALHVYGTVRACSNSDSDRASAERTLALSTPIMAAGATDITAIAAGNSHMLALKSDGPVLSWGNNINGQLRDSTTINRSKPVRVVGLAGVVAIGARASHSLALGGISFLV
ncbi:MAG: hypothetical protein H7232_12000 [Aeromicrobium sp.]|nr:hypothetical protein [Burkholderiales bacterium]